MISYMMAKKFPVLHIAFTLTALGLAFWVGRMSMSDGSEKGESATASEESSARSSRQLSSNRQSSGAGEQAIASASQLCKLYAQGDSTKATLALTKMNSDEFFTLAQDLVATSSLPAYMMPAEISAVFEQWLESDLDAALKFALSTTENSFRSQATCSIFQKLVKMDPELARVKLADVSDEALRWQLKGLIYKSLAISQPDVWLEEIRSDKSLAQRTNMPLIATRWAMEDPVVAAARIQQLPTKLQMQGVPSIAKTWASKDPQAAMVWAQSFSKANVKNAAISAVIGSMAFKNPDAAIAALDTIPSSARRTGISAIFKTLSNTDFERALAKASALEDPNDQRMAYDEMLSDSNYNSGLNIEQITAFTAKLPSDALRNKALDRLGYLLTRYDSKYTESILKTYPEKDQIKIRASMFEDLTYSDPQWAMEIYQSLPPGNTESYIFNSIVNYIVMDDPEAALAMVLQEKSSYKQVQAVESVFKKFSLSDPNGAIKRLDDLPEGALRKEALEGIAEGWAENDPDAAIRWANTLPESEKNKAMLSILPEIAKSSPQDAANVIDNFFATSDIKINSSDLSCIYSLMDTWAKTDPTTAGAWTAGLEDGKVKTLAIRELASKWYKQDSDGVADWIDQLPQGKNRDDCIGSIAIGLQQRDPATAFAWAESIGDAKSRSRSLSYIVNSWKNHDKGAAQTMIEQADLSDAERTSLLKNLK